MNRLEYMQELERLLADIPAEEREDAINYYNDYFDAGGEENEEETIAALGSPEQLASTIRLANASDEVIDGEFTEAGYVDNLRREANELDKYTQIEPPKAKKKKDPLTVIILVILAIFASPILIPIAIAVISVVFGIGIAVIATVFGIAVAIVASGIAVFAAGIAGAVASVGAFSTNVFGAMCMLGISLIAIALGVFFILLCINIVVKVIPPVARWFVKVVKSIVNWFGSKFNRKETVKNEEF